jgi:hypothetical protein
VTLVVTLVVKLSASPKNKNKNKSNTNTIPLPPSLDTEAFRKAWTDWLAYRRERRAGLTPATIQKQLATCERFGAEKAIRSINRSIENGWLGLFDPLEERNGSATSRLGRVEAPPGKYDRFDQQADTPPGRAEPLAPAGKGPPGPPGPAGR